MRKKILLLGSTGSIGINACNSIRRFPEEFEIVGVASRSKTDTLIAQAKEFLPKGLYFANAESLPRLRDSIPSSIKIYDGENGLIRLVEELDYDILLNALVGAVGFQPTVSALLRNKKVALANKESLVIGGELITSLIAEGKGSLLPIDSEHSAILQCLNGENMDCVECITITASGGPFRDMPIEAFKDITPAQALRHPNWCMGDKITIDSATLINKGFEVIEAHHLFKVPYKNIEVLIHPQSIIHSMVTFNDGAVMAQCGIPDMELPIQYALTYPKRYPIPGKRLQLDKIATLTFIKPDYERFPCLKFAIDAGISGGTVCAALNAANEIAVHQFLNGKIPFTAISTIIQEALNRHVNKKIDSVGSIMETDIITRKLVTEIIAPLMRI